MRELACGELWSTAAFAEASRGLSCPSALAARATQSCGSCPPSLWGSQEREGQGLRPVFLFSSNNIHALRCVLTANIHQYALSAV